MKASDFTEIDLEAASVPPTASGFYELITAHYWAVTASGKGLLYRKYSKQCNSHKSIMEQERGKDFPGVGVKFYPSIWLSINPSDFA